MDEILYFFTHLLDTSSWPARWHCGTWTEFHGWLYIISDLLIWSAYFAIPLLIIKYITTKKDIGFSRVFILFACFILACGSTHFLDAVMFWSPVYRLSAIMRTITGIISWITVINLVKILPVAFALKSPQLLEKELKLRVQAEKELGAMVNRLNEAEKIGRFGHFEWNINTGEMNWSPGMGLLFDIDYGIIKRCSDYKKYLAGMEGPLLESSLINSFLSNEYVPSYQIIITETGDILTLYIHGSVSYNDEGEAVGIIGTVQDVTELKKNKKMLDESRQLFKSAFNHSPLGIALVSLEGNMIDLNPAVCQITGYDENELREMNFLDFTHPDDLESTRQQMDLLLNREQVSFQNEKRLIKKDNAMIWSIFSQSIVWSEGNASFFVCQIVDITENKQLFHQLSSKNSELENANENLSYHINHANEFNRIIGHNLRGPASTLITVADYIQTTDDVEEKVFLLSKVKDTSQLIVRTLEDLRDFIEIKLNDLEGIPCNFEKSIIRGMKMLSSEIKETNAVIDSDLTCKGVVFPEIYLDSIVFNLISNAIKYRNPGSVPTIKVSSYFASDRKIILEVQDNGIGIDLQKHGNEIFKYKRIFHSGYQSYGLGLFLIKTQLEAHGGKVEVYSEPNKGSTFRVTFLK